MVPLYFLTASLPSSLPRSLDFSNPTFLGGGAGGAAPNTPPKKVGLEKSRLLGRLERIEAVKKDNGNMGDLVYRNRKGGSAKARKGLGFT